MATLPPRGDYCRMPTATPRAECPAPARSLPLVPGMNASAMGMRKTIGHTPWRVSAPRDRVTGAVTGKPLPAKKLDPRPTGGKADQPRAATTKPRKGNSKSRNRSRAARAARSRNS